MNTSKTLFTTLNVLIFLIILTIGVGLLFTFFSVFGVYFEGINFKNEIPYADLNGFHFLFMMLNLSIYFIFIYGLFKLRAVAKLFLNNTFYNLELGKNCNLSGKSFVLSGIFWWIINGLSTICLDHTLSIGVSEKTFIYLFFIIMGMFLILTSKLFNNAFKLKSENDLTI